MKFSRPIFVFGIGVFCTLLAVNLSPLSFLSIGGNDFQDNPGEDPPIFLLDPCDSYLEIDHSWEPVCGTSSYSVVPNNPSSIEIDIGPDTVGFPGIIQYGFSPRTNGTVEFYMRVAQNNNWVCFQVRDGGGTSGAALTFAENGQLYFCWGNPFGGINCGFYQIQHWYKVKMIFDTISDNCTVYLDDVLISNDVQAYDDFTDAAVLLFVAATYPASASVTHTRIW